jgi:hypothetical protein
MKKLFLQTTLLVMLTVSGFSQTNNFWLVNTQGRADIPTDQSVSRQSYPKDFKLFHLDFAPFQQEVFSIVGSTPAKRSTIISLPNAAGGIEEFEIYEASNFEPALQAQFPEIRSYSGKGITDRYATLKLSISPGGIQTMIFRTERDNEFIEPYSRDHTVYSVYSAQRKPGTLPWNCTTEDRQVAVDLFGKAAPLNNLAARSTGDLKTMRLAQSVTAEYSNYFGATSSSQVSLVMAAINNTLTRCNGVYEKDLALHLNLIANTTSVIYYNPSTDPYSAASTGAGGAWNNELQNTLTSVIGEANYDIGHLFGASGGGGNAGCIGCVCTNGSKGKGFTSPADGVPQGDNFDIDYVVHEVGHQLGGNHTFSMNNEGTGVNKEPGSGITIMGYAGITSQDLAPHSFDFYHQATLAQIQSNLGTKTCPVTTGISATNATPVVAAMSNYAIPKSTPFALTGSASDANTGDVLTYCWEQNDNASSSQTGASSVASATKASGPNWISFRPTTSPTRYFPQLSTILAGGTVTGPLSGGDAGANTEALSSVARTLNFRLTVRDNAVYRSTSPVSVGQTQFTDMVVTVNGTAGPFAVTAPNTAVSWVGGSSQTITWSVNSTNLSPINCANVKISLSTDGGQTFPTVLTSNTPNDGTEVLAIPNTPTTTARIKVEAVGNIFFDISNANFTITSGSSCSAPSGLTASGITTSGATISWTAVSGALSYDVDYKTSASGTWINAATATTSTSVNLSGLASSTVYDWRVRTNCSGSSSAYSAAQFTTASVAVCNAPSGLGASAITTSSATVSWTAVSGALNYDVDYKLTSSGTWINAATATTSTSVGLGGLTASSVYDWRVRTNCSGGSSSYSAAQFTTSAAAGCGTAFEPNETQAAAAAISSGVTNSAAISSTTDIDYFKITTTATSNITYNLVGPSGVDYDLYIYNSAGTQIGSGVSSTATETVSLSNQSAGSYYIKVIGYNGANSATCYTIKATATTVTGCQSSYDNSTNGTISGAATIPFNTNITGLISPSGDIDNYKFVITTGGTITVTLGTLPGDYDLKLLNSAGTQVGISQNGSTTSETINYTAAAGTYYAQVYGYNGANSSTTCYTLKVQLGTATRNEEITKTPVVSVYPNPVRGELKIDMGTYAEPVSVTVTDMYGRKISTKAFAGTATVNTSKLASGVYLVTITDNKGVIIKQNKIVKE